MLKLSVISYVGALVGAATVDGGLGITPDAVKAGDPIKETKENHN